MQSINTTGITRRHSRRCSGRDIKKRKTRRYLRERENKRDPENFGEFKRILEIFRDTQNMRTTILTDCIDSDDNL